MANQHQSDGWAALGPRYVDVDVVVARPRAAFSARLVLVPYSCKYQRLRNPATRYMRDPRPPVGPSDRPC
ncbi:hypothetical protein RRF57_001214 [Xylaria bambusicola]|uniref:Uncharacterized protein n=1 Tax=Xylaria bambusicola TaxID=326684 RepID=A0AAN7UBI4_9PEZI